MAKHRTNWSRFGFTVSRLWQGGVRNRVRRRLKEIIRLNRHAFPKRHCFVIIARPEAAQADYASLQHDLLSIAKQANSKQRTP